MRDKRIWLWGAIFHFLLFFIFLTPSVFSYDNLGISARATGMGNAFSAVADDPSAVFYNPAGLAQLKNWHLGFLYNKRTTYGMAENEDPYLFFGTTVIPITEKFNLALSGSQNGSWADPTSMVTNNIGILSLSGWLSPELAIGANAKALYNSNYGKKKGIDFDLGLLYFPVPNFSLGMVGENLYNADMKSDRPGEINPLHRLAKLGLAYKYLKGGFLTRLALDTRFKEVKDPYNKTYNLNSFGVEQWFGDNKSTSFALRAGYTLGEDYDEDYNQLSLGFSFRFDLGINRLQLDYSWQEYPFKTDNDFVGDHRVSLTIGLGKAKRFRDLAVYDKPSVGTLPKGYVSQKVKEKIKPEDFEGFRLDVSAEVEYLSLGVNQSVMFLVKPQIQTEVERWKFYITRERPRSWDTNYLNSIMVKSFQGKGRPSLGILWDLKQNNVRVKDGEYYFALVVQDTQGQKWYSTWYKVKIK